MFLRRTKGGKKHVRKRKKTIEEISKAVSGMNEAEKNRFLGIAEGMSIMKDMSKKQREHKLLKEEAV